MNKDLIRTVFRKKQVKGDELRRYDDYMQYCKKAFPDKSPTRVRSRVRAKRHIKLGYVKGLSRPLVQPIIEDIPISKTGMVIYPESIPFISCMGGCAKDLFFYLLIFKIDPVNYLYRFGRQEIDQFADYCSKINKSYSASTIEQAHRELVRLHITVSLPPKRQYMMNPMVAGKNQSDRENAIETFAAHQRAKYCDEFAGLLPGR